MIKKIQEFIYPTNSDLNDEENLRVYNGSSHNVEIHQNIFYYVDTFAKKVIIDLVNAHKSTLFDDNMLNIVEEEENIKKLIEIGVNKRIDEPISNPEMIYRGFRFVKPATLLPEIHNKLYLIKQIGKTVTGEIKSYLINPYFFGFKLSFDLFMVCANCSHLVDELYEGLSQILIDKYGYDFVIIFDYVYSSCLKACMDGNNNGDENDETLIREIQDISGILNKDIFYQYIYNSSFLSANILREQIAEETLE